MSRSGGARVGAGRPLGSLNRRAAELAAEALGEGLSPAAYMLAIMRDELADEKRRDWAAEKLAPFVHPRPSPIDRTVNIDLPSTATMEGIDKALDAIIAAMASGTISPGEGQSFISVIETRRKAIETGEILERIKKLEETKR